MERSQFWILIALGVACGIFLEVIKGPSSQPIKLAGFTKFETLLDEGRQVYVPIEEIPATKVIKAEPIATIAQNEAPVVAPEVKPAPAADAANKKADEEKKKADEKKKKDEEDKKKKKKKKKATQEVAAGAQDAQQPPSSDDDEKKKGFGDDESAGAGGGAGGYSIGAPMNSDRQPVSVQEWEAYLMKDVDLNRLSKFISAYQAGQVKVDVFYPVVEAMLEDTRPHMRELGVVALGATPSLKSFGMLVEVEHADASSEVKDQANVTLKSYARLENLRHLLIVISAGEPVTTAEAISLVRLSANTHLKSASVNSLILSQGSTAHRASSPSAYFVQLLGPLRLASTKNGDANVRIVASQAYNEIQTLMTSAYQPQAGQQQPPIAAQSTSSR
jgi:hypothetical protein